MSEFHIHLPNKNINVNLQLQQYANEWECELEPVLMGFVLLPEYILRIHGIFCIPTDYGWKIAREEDATTWEDYLFVKLAHLLASEYGGTLYYGESTKPYQATPDKFETFDHYVHTVLENVPEMLKDTKKYWIYAHRKRTLH